MYLKDKINMLVAHSENENIRDLYRHVNYIQKHYQPEKGSAKGEIGNGHVDFHSILNR